MRWAIYIEKVFLGAAWLVMFALTLIYMAGYWPEWTRPIMRLLEALG